MPRAAALTLLVLTACGGVDPLGPSPEDDACTAPAGMGSPATIEDTVELINALDKPVTLPCLLESLDRPLGVRATSHVGSAQPPEGPENPRIFVILGDLWLSVVTKGEGRPLLEFGVRREGGRSLKGELRFPIDDEVHRSAPYVRIDEGTGTVCANCHVNEERDRSIDFARAYQSIIVEVPDGTGIALEGLQQLWADCDADEEPDRCAMFDGILGHGDVADADFGP
ncbi:MAG: hypothetical protein R3B72_49290 [Polyangiaceae bacterium]